MAVVRTLDPLVAFIEIQISPGCEELVSELLDYLKKGEGIDLVEKDASRTFFITTMGCQMNDCDSDYLAQSLGHLGLSPVDDPNDAYLILINTCTVRAKAEQKAFSHLGRMSVIKRRKPEIILGVVGCMAQQQGTELIKRFPQIDFVMGPRELGRIQEVLNRIGSDRQRVVATDLNPAPPSQIPFRGYFEGRVTGYISIMQGCNNFCTYCIVPYVRGREISRSPDDIIAEARNLITEGVKEITLLGQNVNSYRWEGEKRWDFVSLLREVSGLNGLLRLRFTTSHPKDLSDELIQCFVYLNNLCPHLHLPLQAGSNSVLKRMKRGYTREHYIDLIAKLRSTNPDIAITSDIMVGFPGESENEFSETLDLIGQVRFDAIFSFKYSDRKGTFAYKLNEKVDETEKASRLSVLQNLQRQITLEKNRALEGKQMEVLVEGQSKKGRQLTGRTGTNKVVNFDCDSRYIGCLVKLSIKHGLQNSLQGEIEKTI
ncbi:MAG: tRNA (N6-isopentenyl adenosine(37)-C2)-methylthiotransferase MiaB [Deltaproteobacteria bacterium]|nr:tRNA (N6-isopentenyl adenosine(37)-C2)-methylthiotransferase MiaB [Deltaproteobacteria bacterium]MBW1908069.1 tRNA (N6-isopentenyl adenosine(37)-C2)-methylthiotransferase MiaB [Deltaproteobacteria bacterium]MBW2168195.1 tRNA (N6-isopentenyl adenosine(37)-C2)-methylthiotransferase MiaB [Deltaproteobacteria bacterium]